MELYNAQSKTCFVLKDVTDIVLMHHILTYFKLWHWIECWTFCWNLVLD